MNYLAIKDTKGKGVYQYTTKEERSNILKGLGLSQSTGKVFTKKNEALAYAGVKEVANRPQQVVTNSNNTNSAMKLIQKFRDKGYDFAMIELIDGYKFDIILNDFSYLATRSTISERAVGTHEYIDGEFTACVQAESIWNIPEDMFCFSEYRNDLLRKINNYNVFLEEYVEAEEHRNWNEYSVVDAFYDIYNSNCDEVVIEYLVDTMPGTKIEAIDNYLFFDMVGTIVGKEYDHNGIKFFWHEYDDGDNEESTVIYDYALNTDHILSIIPGRSSWKITDEEFLEVTKYL